MKKLISLTLILVLCLSLAACGKEPTLADLLECPAGASIDELESFLTDCGFEIENTSDTSVTFAYGNWDGNASATGISLSQTLNPSESDIDAMREEIQEICGEPYNESTSTAFNMTSTTEFYTDGNSIIVLDVTSGGMSGVRVFIYPGAAGK